MAKKKRKIKKKIVRENKIDVDQILLRNRQVFLFGVVSEELIYKVIEKIIALDKLSQEPIVLYINSPGGNISDGFALIDVMRGIGSPVITVIVGEACSMAGIISIAGVRRYMSANSTWMAHDMAGGIDGDYTTKVIDRAEYLAKEQKRLLSFIRDHTKLNEKEIEKAVHGELWFHPTECLKKGIVDEILKDQ